MTLEETRGCLVRIYEENYETLIIRAMRIVSSRMEAEDIVQVIMERMLQIHILKRLSGLSEEEIRAYILRAIHNEGVSLKRRAENQMRDWDCEMDRIESRETLPEERVLEAEGELEIWKLLEELPEKERKILMKICEEPKYTYVGLGKELGMDRKTAAKRHEKGKEALKAKLKKRGWQIL